MTDDERKAFNEEWPKKLFEGGWICATWPKEYGGKGLTTMQGVVLAEEFASAKAPMRGRLLRRHARRARRSCSGAPRSRRRSSCRRSSTARCAGARASASRTPAPTSPVAEDHRGARRRRVGHQRPEGVDHAGPARRLLLPAHPHRSGRAEARGHLLPPRADAPGRHRGARHHPARRHRRVLRGVLRRRPLPEGQRRRRRQQRLEGRQHHARLRAWPVGDHRLPALRRGVPASWSRRRRPTARSTIRSSASG